MDPEQGTKASNEGYDTGATTPLLAASNATLQDGPTDQFETSDSSGGQPLNIQTYCLFLVFGMGVSWTMPDGLWVQVAYFERFQPEGTNLALLFSIALSVTAVMFVPLYIWLKDKINYRYLSWGMLILEILCCIITMLWWDVTLSAMSIILFSSVFTSGMIGNVFYILLVPYFTKINNYICAPIISGQTAASAVISGLALVQRPGDLHPLFEPIIFFMITLFAILIPSAVAYVLLERGYLKNRRVQLVESNDDTMWYFGLPSWWKLIWKYVALHAYLVTIIWVFDAALIPYAVISTSLSGGDNTDTEQYAFCLMYVGMVVGSLVVNFWRIDNDTTISILAAVFTIFEGVFLWISLDDDGFWKWEGADILLVVLLFWLGWGYGFLVPTLIVAVDEQNPSLSLIMNQYMSISTLVVMFVFVWIVYYFIESVL